MGSRHLCLIGGKIPQTNTPPPGQFGERRRTTPNPGGGSPNVLRTSPNLPESSRTFGEVRGGSANVWRTTPWVRRGSAAFAELSGRWRVRLWIFSITRCACGSAGIGGAPVVPGYLRRSHLTGTVFVKTWKSNSLIPSLDSLLSSLDSLISSPDSLMSSPDIKESEGNIEEIPGYYSGNSWISPPGSWISSLKPRILSPGPGFTRDPADQRADIKESQPTTPHPPNPKTKNPADRGGDVKEPKLRGFYSDDPTPLVVQWDFLTGTRPAASILRGQGGSNLVLSCNATSVGSRGRALRVLRYPYTRGICIF